MGYYNYPKHIAQHFGLSRKEWLKLSRSEKCSFVRKYDWETSHDKMTEGREKAVAGRKQRMELLQEAKA